MLAVIGTILGFGLLWIALGVVAAWIFSSLNPNLINDHIDAVTVVFGWPLLVVLALVTPIFTRLVKRSSDLRKQIQAEERAKQQKRK